MYGNWFHSTDLSYLTKIRNDILLEKNIKIQEDLTTININDIEKYQLLFTVGSPNKDGYDTILEVNTDNGYSVYAPMPLQYSKIKEE